MGDTPKATQEAFDLLYHACKEFVRKCDIGQASSTQSYRQMKEALTVADKEGV